MATIHNLMIQKKENQDLTAYNTFRMRVKCKTFIEYDSVADLIDIDFDKLPKPIKHIGGGSNLLFSGNFSGTILHSAVKFIYELPEEDTSGNEVLVSVGAGVVFDDFCRWAAENRLWGPENLSHIPGETGAAAVQNIGAYGAEIADIVRQVYCYDTMEEEFVHFNAEDCRYGYRDSAFKAPGMKDRYIVTNVVFALTRDRRPRLGYRHVLEALAETLGLPAAEVESSEMLTPALVRETVIGIRKAKLPEVSELGSAGSFFKNPVIQESAFRQVQDIAEGTEVPHYMTDNGIKIPAAWLIEQCGWKGKTCGNAGVYGKQPLVLVNATGHATPQEIIDLKDRIIASVMEKFGIGLQMETEII